MHGDARHLQRLADTGFDVYLYDQVGVGRSTRLADPTEYTIEHAVADLEAFRQAIGGVSEILCNGPMWTF
jgi:proline iminopeptidase